MVIKYFSVSSKPKKRHARVSPVIVVLRLIVRISTDALKPEFLRFVGGLPVLGSSPSHWMTPDAAY